MEASRGLQYAAQEAVMQADKILPDLVSSKVVPRCIGDQPCPIQVTTVPPKAMKIKKRGKKQQQEGNLPPERGAQPLLQMPLHQLDSQSVSSATWPLKLWAVSRKL